MESEASWIAVGLAAVSMVGTALATWQARRAGRDKMEFDQRTHDLETKVAHQGEQIQDCEDDRETLRTAVDKCQDEHEKSRELLDREREARHRLEVRVASLERQTGSGT